MGKMRGGLFDYHGRTIFRVDRRMARMAFDEGYTVIFCPVNLHPASHFGLEMPISHDDIDIQFDEFVHRYEIMNCDHANGQYPAFYMFEDETRTED